MKTIFPLIISNTDLTLLSQCELRWYRERSQCLRKYGFNIDLTAGAAFAKGIELTRTAFYFSKLDSREAIEIGYEHILESMHESMKDEDTDVLKSPERMALALKDYFKKFPLESSECIPMEREDGSFAIEHTLTAELPVLHPELDVPLIFKGKLDMLGREMGRLYTFDEKTCKTIASNSAAMLKTAGQFIGYSWLAREKGIIIEGAKVRKVAIQVKETKVEEIQIPITEYMVDMWFKSLVNKLEDLVSKYKLITKGKDFNDVLTRDYQLGCTSFNKPCGYADACASSFGEKFLATEFEQLVWDSEGRKEVSIEEYRTLMGLK